jgi:hypothetical protein
VITFFVGGVLVEIEVLTVFRLLAGVALITFLLVSGFSFDRPWKRLPAAFFAALVLIFWAAIIHEVGHAIAILGLGEILTEVVVKGGGMSILGRFGGDMWLREWAIASAAGPLFTLIFSAICALGSKISAGSSFSVALKATAVFCLIDSLYNLIPFSGDGGVIFEYLYGSPLAVSQSVSGAIHTAMTVLVVIGLNVWWILKFRKIVKASPKGTTK